MPSGVWPDVVAIVMELIAAPVRPTNMRLQTRQFRILAVVASIAALAACGSRDASDRTTAVPEEGSGASSTPASEPIVGSRWVLHAVETASASIEAPTSAAAFLEIDDTGQVLGNTGCNGFGGAAEVAEGSVTFSQLIATKKACSGELGQIDTAMLSVLDGEVTAEVTGGKLTLTNADGETLTLHVSEEPVPSPSSEPASTAT